MHGDSLNPSRRSSVTSADAQFSQAESPSRGRERPCTRHTGFTAPITTVRGAIDRIPAGQFRRKVRDQAMRSKSWRAGSVHDRLAFRRPPCRDRQIRPHLACPSERVARKIIHGRLGRGGAGRNRRLALLYGARRMVHCKLAFQLNLARPPAGARDRMELWPPCFA